MTTDGGRLRQIVLNLLTNAVKFTEQGSVRLSAQQDAEVLRIVVADTGPGVAAEHLSMIFEAFTQVDASPTRGTGGAGLGLAISSQLATRLGGTLTATSHLGQGSEFHLTLPVA